MKTEIEMLGGRYVHFPRSLSPTPTRSHADNTLTAPINFPPPIEGRDKGKEGKGKFLWLGAKKSEDVKRPLAVVAYFVMEKFSSLLSTINFLRVFSRPSRASFTRSPRARATATSSAFSRSTSAALASPWRTTDASTGSCASTGRRGHSRSGRRTGTSYQCEIQRHCHCDCNTVVFL